jgi:hypothetical protein
MADISTPSATDIRDELGAYFRTNNKEIRKHVYQKSVTAGYMKTVVAVQGKFPALNSITGRVVQGFTAAWTPMGLTEFTTNELQAYKQKINFPITPANILNSWISYLYNEDKTPAEMSISQYIVQQELLPAIARDREDLIGKSVYNKDKLNEFGHSMNGIQEMIRLGTADGSMFQIPIEAPSLSNMCENIDNFELGLPDVIKPLLTRIYMPSNLVEAYRLDYRNKYGVMPSYTDGKGMKTFLGQRDLIPLPSLNGTQVIFATPDENFLRLIDINDANVLNDVQVQDYTVKIFGEFWEGVGFWSNQLVVVAVPGGLHKGLGKGIDGAADNALTEKYFGVQSPALA